MYGRAADQVLQRAGVAWTSLCGMPGGAQHDLTRVTLPDGSQQVLKVAREGADLGDLFDEGRVPGECLDAEEEALTRLPGVPVPRPYRRLTPDPPAALMGQLQGTAGDVLWSSGRLGEQGLRHLLYGMGEVLASVHRVRRPEGPTVIPDVPGAEAGVARLLHGDFHLGNVLAAPAGMHRWRVLGVVDWVLCRWGPPELDVVELEISVFRQLPAMRASFLAGYAGGGGRPLDAAYLQGWVGRELTRRLGRGVADERIRQRWELWLASLPPAPSQG